MNDSKCSRVSQDTGAGRTIFFRSALTPTAIVPSLWRCAYPSILLRCYVART
jgi:hypothetical protein